MFIDASAIVGIIAAEADAASLAGRLAHGRTVLTSAVAVTEASLALARIANAPPRDTFVLVERFLTEVGAQVMPIDATTGRLAIQAFSTFGKGRHRAALNLGDCFAYACARQAEVPLLCKGDDFPLTDIELA
ncbi:type II toxin-antitoxin system VapC family toxin [Rhodopila sp.]|jgi:ribonuclease VapC|uniref:type II toxin-antitoxin system VapC family toxin n=1 Tax=Rhodopila sp. TaxID=2480087 RepID=UPI002B9948D5|nr:type II toxin-antitoxin system VapC family toxin [Rhodopila sp.]HVZ09811.1 type II toxin-antitoxin system VapC family toxin [Rhodopila sp.]